MTIRRASLFLVVAALAACGPVNNGNDGGDAAPADSASNDSASNDSASNDSATGDATVEDASVNDVVVNDATVEDSPSADAARADSGGDAASDGAAGPSFSSVHPMLTGSCSPCHSTGASGGHRIAMADIAMAYTQSQRMAGACSGLTVGACSAQRVRAGTMPPGGLPMAQRTALADALDTWVAGGQAR